MILNSVVAPAAATITHTHQVMTGPGGAVDWAGNDVAGSVVGVFIVVDAGDGAGASAGAGIVSGAVYFTEPTSWDWAKYSVTSNDPMANLTSASIISPNTL